MVLKYHQWMFAIVEFFFREMIEDNPRIEVDYEENYKHQVNNTHPLLKEIINIRQ
jgi:hypothetical protein